MAEETKNEVQVETTEAKPKTEAEASLEMAETEIVRLKKRARERAEQIDKLDQKIDVLETSVSDLEGIRAGLERRLREATGEINRLRNARARVSCLLHEALGEAQTRVNYLQKRVEELAIANQALSSGYYKADEVPWQIRKAFDEALDARTQGKPASINFTELFQQYGAGADITLLDLVTYAESRGVRLGQPMLEAIEAGEMGFDFSKMESKGEIKATFDGKQQTWKFTADRKEKKK